MQNGIMPLRVSLLALALVTPLTAPILARAQDQPEQVNVARREVSVKAEIVLMAGKGKTTSKSVIAMLGRTANEGTVKMQMTTGGKPNADSPLVVSAGDYNLTLQPTINGDGSIQVNAEVDLDITYRLPGDSHFQHLRSKLEGRSYPAEGRASQSARSSDCKRPLFG